ncbi:MAG TPA: beta-phosphoglucomutase family hydrolase [Steroidobacteraceae bacterium]|jgi:beta-phosphoglucomutase family hydrolase|nr:beta-phosphoglucomutase family hydrolase [Steroidobacteraceae bacterium]
MYDHFDALIFDMDGTLVDSGKLHEHAWSEMLTKYGVPIDRALMRSLAGVPTKATIETLLQHFKLTVNASLDEMNDYKEQIVREHMHRFVKPTALLELVHRYHGNKRMAVGTGASTTEANTILKICKVDHYLDAIVGADQVANPKPAPDIFLRCAELMNVTPDQCVVFEDSKLGLQAARRAGMKAVDVLEVHQVVNDYFL